jgi:hypothetical protein
MRTPATALAALVTLAALALADPARADFEGLLVSKMSGEMSGTGRTWISKQGIRSEMEMQVPEAHRAAAGRSQVHMVTIIKAAEPNRFYLVNEDQKSYQVFENKPGEHGGGDDAKYTVKRLGKAKVAGFSCEDVSVTSEQGQEFEMCLTSELMGGSEWLRALEMRSEDRGRGLFKALRTAGVKGYPIRWTTKGKDGRGAFAMELVSAERRSVPASTFAVPAGYTKTESMMPMSNARMQKQMEEAMKNMSPEQRKQMREMMKKYGGGKQ